MGFGKLPLLPSQQTIHSLDDKGRNCRLRIGEGKSGKESRRMKQARRNQTMPTIDKTISQTFEEFLSDQKS